MGRWTMDDRQHSIVHRPSSLVPSSSIVPLHEITGPDEWDRTLLSAGNAHLLQSWRWGEFKRPSGWSPWRLVAESVQHDNDNHGAPVSHSQPSVCAQVLFRKLPQLPVPISIAYIPRGPEYIAGLEEDASTIQAFWQAVHAEA